MPSIFNTLHIGYTGLSAAQVGINTTGHNISNAEVDGYTRQRVMTSAATPISSEKGSVGNGVQIQEIKRVFDNFVNDRYTDVSATKEYSDYEQKTLETLSTYFPEIDGVGIKADLTNFYNSWQNLADNPSNDAIKIDLAQKTKTLVTNIKNTNKYVLDLQDQTNKELAVNINEVNDLAQQIAKINVSIDTTEAGGEYQANDLRDKRNLLEKSLARLIGANVDEGQLTANIQVDSNSNTKTGSYSVSVDGFNIVDGNTSHPLHLDNKDNALGFYNLSYERQDGTLIPLTDKIKGGKVGAIFSLRGGAIDTTSGVPSDGVLQNVVSQLDSFAKGLTEATNNLYASSANTRMTSNDTKIDLSSRSLIASGFNVKEGAFDVVVYDIDGNEAGRRKINIDAATVMKGSANSNSIQGQLLNNSDDNNDENATNDIDDYINFDYTPSATGEYRVDLSMKPSSQADGYTFALEDKLTTSEFASGSNFAGAFGLGRYFDGDSASNINLNFSLRENPTLITPGYSGGLGDNRVALNVVQQQFESYDFDVAGSNLNTTTYGMYDLTATYVGTNANKAILNNETVSTQFNAVELEYNSVSKVSVDEEMTNLIKYQTSYGASAKLITTIDQMMQTLLGIKQ